MKLKENDDYPNCKPLNFYEINEKNRTILLINKYYSITQYFRASKINIASILLKQTFIAKIKRDFCNVCVSL